MLVPAAEDGIAVATCTSMLESEGRSRLIARLLKELINDNDYFAVTLLQPKLPLPTLTQSMPSGRKAALQ